MFMQKVSETKSWFYEKLNKIDKSLTRPAKKKRQRTQSNTIRNERREVKTDTKEIQRIVRKYYEQTCANKLDNLEEMGNY